MIKAKPWNGKDLKGTWEFTLKIDGVRALWDGAKWVSRAGKPLYNIPDPIGFHIPEEGFEVYLTAPGRSSKENYRATIECVRAKTKDRPIPPSALYSLEPLDPRLYSGSLGNISTASPYLVDHPTADEIREALHRANRNGYEGLVLRQGDKWLKVKPVETYDVPVTGIIEGTGKHKGRMGALMTPMGKVGTGFTDKEREWWWTEAFAAPLGKIIGAPSYTIEVSCMQLTPDGKFRHPRFERIRYDK